MEQPPRVATDCENHELDSDTCRICYESDLKSFVIPCNCTGSSKKVHQECLKTWISFKFQDVRSSFCEICKYQFKIRSKSQLKYNPLIAISTTKHYFCIMLISIIFVILSCIATFTLAMYKLDFYKEETKSIAIISVFGAFTLLSIVFCIISILKISFIRIVADWEVLPISRETKKRVN